jgi:hypothetical protein
MSEHDASQLRNVYLCLLSFSTSAMSAFPTHVLIRVYFCRTPPVFVRGGIVTIKLATRVISVVGWLW